jgi:hypothetical protein
MRDFFQQLRPYLQEAKLTCEFRQSPTLLRSLAMKFISTLTSILRATAVTLITSIATLAIANDAMKFNSAQQGSSTQTIKQPSATRVNDATMTAPKSPAPPTLPTMPMKPTPSQPKPPLSQDAQKATLVSPSVLGNAITGLGDNARGIVASESLVIQGRGFGASPGRVEISVQTSASSQQELSFRVAQWSDTEIRGSVGASSGIGDGKAAMTIYPAGKSVTEHISSGHAGNHATRNPWRFNFTATRVEQTFPASAAQPNHLIVNLAEPAAREVKQGAQLLNGIAYSRIRAEGDTSGLGCRLATPQDRFQLKLAVGFELKRVNGRDLNAQKRYGLSSVGACDIRSTIPAGAFSSTARDGSFDIRSTWEVVNRLGRRGAEKTGTDCGSSRFLSVTKTPLGFEWDNIGTDRCAANAEYVIDSFTVSGPAGVNPFLGTPSATGGAIK